MPKKTFPEVLKRARASKKLSQHGLAKASGIRRGAIAQFETGYRTPNLATLRQLAVALDVAFCVEVAGWAFVPRPIIWAMA